MVAAMTKLLSFRINTFDLTCISWNGKIFWQRVCFWVLDFQCGAEKVSSPNPSVEKMFLSLPEIMLMQHFEHLNRISWFTSVGGFNEISWEFSMKLPLLWFYIALGTNNKHVGPTWGWVPWASDPATRTWRGWESSDICCCIHLKNHSMFFFLKFRFQCQPAHLDHLASNFLFCQERCQPHIWHGALFSFVSCGVSSKSPGSSTLCGSCGK